MIAYVFDETLREELNLNEQNYWDIYIREINNQLGIRAMEFSCDDIAEAERLNAVRTLIIGRQSWAKLHKKAKKNIEKWVIDGGMLIGFALEDKDEIFGIKIKSVIKQKDDYSITGYFEWQPHRLTMDIHPYLFLEQRRVMISDILATEGIDGEEIAKLCAKDGKTTETPVIIFKKFGTGSVCWFAFDVAKTIWLLHQGRPVWEYPEDGNQPRTCELQILGQNLRKVFYADEILFLLQNLIGQNGHAFVYQIPPHYKEIPEALFYWGGDEYRGPVEYSLKASDWMKKKGLPFHINIESEHHPMTKEQAKHIWNNGHELSVYYTLDVPDSKGGYKLGDGVMREELFVKQNNRFSERFGYRPITSVNHCLRWKGWVEPAKYIEKAGGKADNSFAPYYAHRPNPWGNAPAFGSGFGTCFPFYFYEDYKGKNRKINVIEEPIICYEIGHRGTVRGSATDEEALAFEEIHLAVDLAVKFHFTMNMFYHPRSIFTRKTTRQAIEELLRYVNFRQIRVAHMGNDELQHWWEKRSEAQIEEKPNSLNKRNSGKYNHIRRYKCQCEYPSGMIAKMIIDAKDSIEVKCDGQDATYKIKREFGQNWLYIIVPQGKHEIEVFS